MAKISIIIPVGNEAEWKTCEASLRESIAAAGREVEAELLPCWDLEHKGAYVARNEGLKRATGEWIAWVDCDDVVEKSWFGEIADVVSRVEREGRAEGAEENDRVDVIQFDATEVKDGKTRPLAYAKQGLVSGEDFARELLRNDGMPAWLWTRVFRCELFDGASFNGRVKQDYQMFLQILPRIRQVWSIGKPLYRYIRHGHGLSNYVQQMDYHAAGAEFEALIAKLPAAWLTDAQIGLALTMADVAVHSKGDNGSRFFVRKYLSSVLLDRKVPFRLKIKALLAALR